MTYATTSVRITALLASLALPQCSSSAKESLPRTQLPDTTEVWNDGNADEVTAHEFKCRSGPSLNINVIREGGQSPVFETIKVGDSNVSAKVFDSLSDFARDMKWLSILRVDCFGYGNYRLVVIGEPLVTGGKIEYIIFGFDQDDIRSGSRGKFFDRFRQVLE